MMLKTGRRCYWHEVNVGEVFALNGCWCVFYKTSINEARLLTSDGIYQRRYDFEAICFATRYFNILQDTHPIYKLPKSVQRLWKET